MEAKTKKRIRNLACAGLASVVLYSGICGTKLWVNKQIDTVVSERMRLCQPALCSAFGMRVPLEEIAQAEKSIYLMQMRCFYLGEFLGQPILLDMDMGIGSGMMLKGGYFLTAGHCTQPDATYEHPMYGVCKLAHVEYELYDTGMFDQAKPVCSLEKIVEGYDKDFDYALLLVKDGVEVPCYEKGLSDVAREFCDGQDTVVIGYPLGYGRNVRLGNISQTRSDLGKNYITYANNVVPGDSGGAVFVMEDGFLRLAAINAVVVDCQGRGRPGYSVNINYGLRVCSIIEDLANKLVFGSLDEKTAMHVAQFFERNL